MFVTDRAGNPVVDLTPDEFSLFEEGKRKEIEFVRLIRMESEQRPTDVNVVAQWAPPVSPVVEYAARRHFVLVFDLTFNDPASLAKARQEAERFIGGQLGAGEPTAVFALSRTSGALMYSNLTTDREHLVAAIRRVGQAENTSAFLASAGLWNRHNGALSSPGLGSEPGLMGTEMDDALRSVRTGTYAGEEYDKLRAAFEMDRAFWRMSVASHHERLRDFARALDVLPGRKIVLLFTQGFDLGAALLNQPGPGEPVSLMPPGEAGRSFGTQRFDSGLASLLTDSLRRFSTSDCRLYVIDTAGLAVVSDVKKAHLDGPEIAASAFEDTARIGTSDTTLQGELAQRQDSLHLMAEESGGRLIANSNLLEKPLADMLRETSSYYLLGYIPGSHSTSGAFHAIRVQVDREGVRVAARKGWYESIPFLERSPLERDLQIASILNGGGASDLPIEAGASVFSADTDAGDGRVILQVQMPPQGFQARQSRQLEIYAFVQGTNGGILNFIHGIPNLSAIPDPGRLVRAGLDYTDLLDVPSGEHRLFVIVRDLDTGEAGSRVLPLQVSDFSEGSFHMATPVFLRSGSESVKVRGFGAGRTEGGLSNPSASYPLILNGRECIPALHPRLLADRMLVRVYCDLADASAPPPQITAALELPGAGEATLQAVHLQVLDVTADEGNALDFLMLVAPPDVSPGQYELRVIATHEITGATVSATVPVHVTPKDLSPARVLDE